MDQYDWLKIKLNFEDEAPTLLLVDLFAGRKHRKSCANRSVGKES